ncbi:MAG TPA: poly-gamma-glutamate biosynthesis protein [Nitrospiraceae bacterium]|nr:poly-gamma-glutamate biosynthesis protein [Nitrospiraceae bacterium]
MIRCRLEMKTKSPNYISIFLCGDVMTGRGIDQVLPHPSAPNIYESYMKSAVGYVRLAEQVNGPISKPVEFSYIWGDALDELQRMAPDVRIINLETAVTKSEDYEDKGINYRMHPDNIPCITAARIDACCLANNHTLDWGHSGLIETLETLKKAGVKSSGAGRDLQEAEAPAVVEVPDNARVLMFSVGSEKSGIPLSWVAMANRPGIHLLRDFSTQTVLSIKSKIEGVKQPGDLVIASIHWGGNWGYEIPWDQREFARNLIDEAGVDIIHGHSSHHVKGIEVYKGKLILYGCGDFINDYEGIGGFEEFRADLGLMYFVTVDLLTGRLVSLQMTPTQIKHFSVHRASRIDALWLGDILNHEGKRFGTLIELNDDNILTLK